MTKNDEHCGSEVRVCNLSSTCSEGSEGNRLSCWRTYLYIMKNYRVLDIFQTLQMLPKFKSSFLPNLPSSILWRQHHHSSHGCKPSPCPPPAPSRQKEGCAGFPSTMSLCSILIVATWAQVLTLSCPRLLQLGSKLVLEYLPSYCQNYFSSKQTQACCSVVWPSSLRFSPRRMVSFTW